MRLRMALLVALVLAFALGYAIRSVTSPAAATTHAVSACPQGQHAVVWYTAQTWACQPNS